MGSSARRVVAGLLWALVLLVSSFLFLPSLVLASHPCSPSCTWAEVLEYAGQQNTTADSFIWIEKYTQGSPAQTGYRVYRRQRGTTFAGAHTRYTWLFYKYGYSNKVGASGFNSARALCDWTTGVTNAGTNPFPIGGPSGAQGWFGGAAGSVSQEHGTNQNPSKRVSDYNCFGERVNLTDTESDTTNNGASVDRTAWYAIDAWKYLQDNAAADSGRTTGYQSPFYFGAGDLDMASRPLAFCPIGRGFVSGRSAGQCKTNDTLLHTFFPVTANQCVAQSVTTVTKNQVLYRLQSDCNCIPEGYEVDGEALEPGKCYLRPAHGDPADVSGGGTGVPDPASGDLPGVFNPDGSGGSGGGGGGGGGGITAGDVRTGVRQGIEDAQGTIRDAVAEGIGDALEEKIGEGEGPTEGTYDGTVEPPTENDVVGLVTGWLSSHPLAQVATNSGVQVSGSTSTLSVTIKGKLLQADFATYEWLWDLMGAVIVAASGVWGIFIVIGGLKS